MKKILLSLMLLSGSFNAFSVELNVEIETFYNSLAGRNAQNVYITSREDSVTIQQVVINRGQCRIGTIPRQYLGTLKFGQRVRVTPLIGCSVIEIEVMTDKGKMTYSKN